MWNVAKERLALTVRASRKGGGDFVDVVTPI